MWWTETARWVSEQAGSGAAFLAAAAIILAWVIAGFFVGFSSTLYQLVINTFTTIITFLMVFLLQHTQNRDTAAMHLKLDELIRASAARNELRGIERLSDAELDERIADEKPAL